MMRHGWLVLLCVLAVPADAQIVVSSANVRSSTPAYSTFYIESGSYNCADTGGSGTLGDPWQNAYYVATHGDSLGISPGDHVQLRAGVYGADHGGFDSDTNEATGLSNCDDDTSHTGGTDGTHTTIFFDDSYTSGSSGSPIIWENYPGETVEITGTPPELLAASPWTQCTTNTTVWRLNGLVFSARLPQLWYGIDVANNDPGTQVWMNLLSVTSIDASTCTSEATLDPTNVGRASYDSTTHVLAVHMPDDADPNNYNWRLGAEAGDGATATIQISTDYLTLRQNPLGGKLAVTNGRIAIRIDDDTPGSDEGGTPSDNISIIDLLVSNGGSADYGHGINTRQGTNILYDGIRCQYSIGECASFYCGDTNQFGGASQDACRYNTMQNVYVYQSGVGWSDRGDAQGSPALGHGILLKNCSDCTIQDNHVDGTWGAGISFAVSPIGSSGSSPHGCAETMAGCFGDNFIIRRNEIEDWDHRCTGSGAPYTNNCGTQICGYDNTRSAIAIAGGANGTSEIVDGVVENNMIHTPCSLSGTTSSFGIGVYDAASTVQNIDIRNNAILGTGVACITLNGWTNSTDSGTGTVVANAMDDCGATADVLYTSSNVTPHHDNTYYAANSSDTVVTGPSTYTRSTVTTFESSAHQSDPGFVSTSDLHIGVSSAIDDAIASPTDTASDDFDGETRPASNQAVGADEPD